MLTCCQSFNNAGFIAYQMNRSSVGEGDTAETIRGVLKLDVAMEAACPSKVNEPVQSRKAVPAVALAVLVLLGIVGAANWRALILVVIVMAAALGWWVRG
jgi:hypothetical protein